MAAGDTTVGSRPTTRSRSPGAGPHHSQPPGRDAGGAASEGGERTDAPAGGQHGAEVLWPRRVAGGEAWHQAGRARRVLHLATDADTGRIVASALTDKDADDGSQVGPCSSGSRGRWRPSPAMVPMTATMSPPRSRRAIPPRPWSCHCARMRCRTQPRRARRHSATGATTIYRRARPHRMTRNTARAQCARTPDPCNKASSGANGRAIPPGRSFQLPTSERRGYLPLLSRP